MKAFKKVLSVVLVLAMLMSTFAVTVFAAQPATIDIEAEETTTNGVYKVTVSLTTPNPVCTVDLRLYYPKDVFTLVGKTGQPFSSGSNSAYNKIGQLADSNEYECEMDEDMGLNDTIVLGAGSGSFTFNRAPVASQYGTLSTTDYGCILFNWTANFDALAYLLTASTKTELFSFYMQVNAGVNAGTYEIGQFDGGKAWTIDYTVNGETGSMFTGEQTKADLTINNAKINYAGASLEEKTSQIRFQKSGTDYAGKFDVRTRASISDAAFNSIFASVDEAKEKISDVGFVFAPSSVTFKMADAAAVAQGKSKTGYTKVPVEYIQDCDGYYMFTCLVTDIADSDMTSTTNTDIATGFNAIAYMCVDGVWYFYNANTAVTFKTLYNNHNDQANAAFGWNLQDIA